MVLFPALTTNRGRADMTGQTSVETEAGNAPANASIDQNALDIRQLAKAVLAREFRPRAASVRRLAEAVLSGIEKPEKSKKNKKKSGKKVSAKKRKLAKIPGQQSK